MLKSLTLTNWKSFGDESAVGGGVRNRVQLAPLTLLVGPNASGKSNALDGLRFLQGVAFDYPIGDVLRGRWEGQREVWPPIRGQEVEASRSGHQSFALRAEWAFGVTHFHYELEVDTSRAAELYEERLIPFADSDTPESSYVFDTHAVDLTGTAGPQPGGHIKVALRGHGGGGPVSAIYSSQRSLLGQIAEVTGADPAAVEQAHAVRKALREIAFLEIQPALMRAYKPEHAVALGTSGENISPVLKALPPDKLVDVVDWLSELCAPVLERIDFDSTQLREVMLFLLESGGRRISARSISDGTLRFLGLVTALLTAARGSLIVLEEPDVGLHPSRIHLLVQLLEQVSAKGDVQILATSHSPALLSHLSRESLGNVVAMSRDPETQTTICTRLQDLEHFDTLRDSRHLDHLISTGWIERAI